MKVLGQRGREQNKENICWNSLAMDSEGDSNDAGQENGIDTAGEALCLQQVKEFL